jgi:hypothetical protein
LISTLIQTPLPSQLVWIWSPNITQYRPLYALEGCIICYQTTIIDYISRQWMILVEGKL